MNNDNLVVVPRFERIVEDQGLSDFFRDTIYAVDFRMIPSELRLPIIKALCIGMQPVTEKWHRKTGHIPLTDFAPARTVYSEAYASGSNSFKIFGKTFFKVEYFYLDSAIIAESHRIVAESEGNPGRLNNIRSLFWKYLDYENQDEGLWYDFYDALANIVLACKRITSDGIPVSREEASKAYWAADDKLNAVFHRVRSAVHSENKKKDVIAELESGAKFENYEVDTTLNLMGAASVLS